MGYAMAARTQGGPEVIHRIEIGEITPAAGEVVIEHQAIGINFIDIYIRTGAYPWPIDENLMTKRAMITRRPTIVTTVSTVTNRRRYFNVAGSTG